MLTPIRFSATFAAASFLILVACNGDDGGGVGTSGGSGTNDGGATGTSGGSTSSSGGTTSSSGGTTDAGSSDDGGALSAGPGQFKYKGQVNGQSIAGNCTPKNSADVDSYTVAIAGNQLNIACPGVTGTAVANPAATFILKAYAGLPATFSFNAADGIGSNRKYEVTGWTSATGPRLQAINTNVQSIEVKGTYDSATKHVTGTFVGKWGTPTKPKYEAEGWLEIAFDVMHP